MNEFEKIGLDRTTLLSYEIIDKANITAEVKRKLLFSVYSFRCLFDNAEMTYVNPILKKYDCVFSMPIEAHPQFEQNKNEFMQIVRDKTLYIPYGGLYAKDGDNYALRFDTGSDLFFEFVKTNQITGSAASAITKYSLYELVYKLITLNTATDELRAMWYLMFPYIVLIGTPHEDELYDKICKILINEKVFEKVIDTTYSLNCADSRSELYVLDLPAIVIDFMLPYIEWKNYAPPEGDTREVERFRRWLSKGKFSDVLDGTEKLLNTFPDDDSLLLLNVAARMALEGAVSDDIRQKLLTDTIEILDGVLSRPSEKKLFFLYYYGVALIGLNRIDEALDKFAECLEINPKFESALIMQKAIKDKYSKS